MAANGDVVFVKGQDGNDSDLWDDTALIEAYDSAVNTMKKSIDTGAPQTEVTASGEGEGESSKDAAGEEQTQPTKKRKKNSQNKKKKKKGKGFHKWQAGDKCQSIFSEDGVVYQAVILSVEPRRQTCIVRYCGYGNEEEQPLSAIFQPSAFAMSEKAHCDQSENDSEVSSAAASKCSSPGIPRPQAPTPPRWPWSNTPGSNAEQNMAFGGIPGMISQLEQMQYTGNPPFSSMPVIPPPPPPPLFDDDIAEDNEALYSMLISWYMSGYHTGHYQGLKEGRVQVTNMNMGPSGGLPGRGGSSHPNRRQKQKGGQQGGAPQRNSRSWRRNKMKNGQGHNQQPGGRADSEMEGPPQYNQDQGQNEQEGQGYGQPSEQNQGQVNEQKVEQCLDN